MIKCAKLKHDKLIMPLFPQFQAQFRRTSYTNFLIAFSGGLDSTVLLSLFAKQQKIQPWFRVRAIHIHHGLSKNADHWAEHCSKICDQLSIPLIIKKVQINREKGIEAGAREARYQSIREYIAADETLVTAHHLQDQTETFFLALKRGSGIQGLGAMQLQSHLYNVPIFRPLLRFNRQQLEDYIQKEQLIWIEDESNADNYYERNFLRNHILPPLRKRWSYFDQAVQRSAQHCFEQHQLINELLTEKFLDLYDPVEGSFNIAEFSRFSLNKQRALIRLWLAERQMLMPSLKQLDQCIQDVIFAKQDANPQFQLNDQIIRRYRYKLFITKKFLDLKAVKLNLIFEQEIELPDGLGKFYATKTEQGIQFIWKNYSVQLPLTDQQIQIRFNYSGKVRLDKNKKSEEIKKIWQKFDIPPWQRGRIPLIFYSEELKSAVGFFNIFESDH